MSAEVLREAAALMRKRAEAAPLGPWESGDRIVWNDVPVREWDGSSIVADGDDGSGGCKTPQIAEHIASWHPAVALAVAEAMEGLAEELAGCPEDSWTVADRQWIAVANAYLGQSA